eukprot:m.184178 g.184178  ORF g.184178 m.184178 type:complete len:527 (+) comp16902_c0_seq1:1868-3448(+)
MGVQGDLIRGVVFLAALYVAYTIRLHAVITYGRVIHEFDPWFNYRAAEYLVANGWEKFSTWFDYESWYPIGRPVGTTIYPGLQITASFIYHTFQHFGFTDITLNDVCVFMPAAFACVTCTFTALLTYEASLSKNAAVAAACVMAVIPAHLMRSVAGGFDNESVAVAAICSTFYFYIRSLRNDSSWIIGIFTGISYIYMVGAWGGYVFVLNMIGMHAGFNAVFNYTTRLQRAYSLFYIIGTLGAIQFPVVGLAPLKSLEQLAPAGVFFLLLLREICEIHFRRNPTMSNGEKRTYMVKALAVAGAVGVVVLAVVVPEGYFGPLSARIRGLFVQHTRTGNPLVDSVAEHQATRPEMYFQYFHMTVFVGPVGLLLCFAKRTYAKVFVIMYTLTAMYFSQKMVRLVLLLSPGAAIVTGIAIGALVEWADAEFSKDESAVETETETKSPSKKSGKKNKKAKAQSAQDIETLSGFVEWWNKQNSLRRVLVTVLVAVVAFMALQFCSLQHDGCPPLQPFHHDQGTYPRWQRDYD